MTYITISSPTCFSHAHDFEVLKDVINELSWIKYDGEGGISLLRHGVSFLGFCDRDEATLEDISYGLFAYTFERRIKQWCLTFPTTSIHFFNHMIKDLGHAFFCYDCKSLNHKIL